MDKALSKVGVDEYCMLLVLLYRICFIVIGYSYASIVYRVFSIVRRM